MLSTKDKEAIQTLARQYKVSRVLLFGSNKDAGHKGNDIDLAVEGLPASRFFKFYGDLIFNLSQPVDLVDISKPSRFSKMIAAEGITLYGNAAG